MDFITLMIIMTVFLIFIAALIPRGGKKRELESIVREQVNKHIHILAKKRLQTLKVDDYGRVDSSKWNKEVQYFVNTVLFESMNSNQRKRFAGSIDYFANTIIEPLIRDASIKLEENLAFDNNMSPTDFEHYCATELRKAGWNATVTQVSGDQGVDVLAEKGPLTVSIQCKKYSDSVGNSGECILDKARFRGDLMPRQASA